MPRQEVIISIFVSSPDDVKDERARLEEIIREFNKTWRRELGLSMELLRWETDAYPGIDADAQAVINEQIPNDYDVFVGIMWHRFGTSTKRKGSGTVEEFKQAKKRYEENPDSVQIMFYFKDAPIAPSKVNTEQLAKVEDFRKSLGQEGILYWKFDGLDEFEKLLRLHLTRQVQALNKKLKITAEPSINKVDEQKVDETDFVTEESDLGLIDFIEISEERFAELIDISNRINALTVDLGDKMETHTKELEALSASSQRNAGLRNLSATKRLIAKGASDMDIYASRIEAEIPLFGKNLNEGIDFLIRAVKVSIVLATSENEEKQVRETLREIFSLQEILLSTEGKIQEFRNVIATLPRMTSVLNKSKKNVVSVLDRLLAEFRSGQKLLKEAEQLMKD